MLFSPYSQAGLDRANRIIMPPMTRSRAARGNVTTPLITHVVHAQGGRIFARLSHVGRVSHTS
ncbi:hypothetical protein AOE01nite_33520 [Acetobacter oeni]|uniref:NADH:flavin oxidoreductase/NADH oxidase N-terminal domain-containing protein n=1 Tax=Acetobacter oeni TaxID=304077 RepID=A0A511XQ83_9PROT|nr:hypothetical protein AOE01nite_33520 [Acetobacter oeni]